MRELEIDGTVINEESDCYVIAEIGHNHQGNLETAKKLFLAAKEAGANAAKLQKRDNRSLFTRDMYNKPYDNENSYGATYGEHRDFLEFDEVEYRELQQYAKEIGITFFATAFDFNSADFLAALEVPAFKIASGDLTNIPLLTHVAHYQKPTILSTGGGTLEETRRAYDAVMSINPRLCLLQCTAGYPPEFDQLNLRVITTFREQFPDIVIGFSSHDSGIAMALVAYILGARVVEKHFTLNRAMKGTDHAFSLEPVGMRKIVRDLRRARVSLGDGVKVAYPTEKAPLFKMAKKLVAARNIPAGHILTREDVAIKSPGDGLPPYELNKVVGRRTKFPLNLDENVVLEHLEDPF
jgi:N-acetylneuraminate synthase/sialic acid synthase